MGTQKWWHVDGICGIVWSLSVREMWEQTPDITGGEGVGDLLPGNEGLPSSPSLEPCPCVPAKLRGSVPGPGPAAPAASSAPLLASSCA